MNVFVITTNALKKKKCKKQIESKIIMILSLILFDFKKTKKKEIREKKDRNDQTKLLRKL